MGTPLHGDLGSAHHPADHARPKSLRQGYVPPDGLQTAPPQGRGGKPSLGRLAPWTRPLSKSSDGGQDLCPHVAVGGQTPGVALVGGRVLAPGAGRPAEGQPFFLDILHSLALNIQDPDHYPSADHFSELIDEGDKIRTIYDGSVGASHWLHAAAEEGPPLVPRRRSLNLHPRAGNGRSRAPGGGRMVGEQGRHIRHGQCPILLGTPGSPSTQGPLRIFPSSGLELRLCG